MLIYTMIFCDFLFCRFAGATQGEVGSKNRSSRMTVYSFFRVSGSLCEILEREVRTQEDAGNFSLAGGVKLRRGDDFACFLGFY